MTPTLRIDFTVEDICKGFVYNKSEGRGLLGWMVNLLFSLSISAIIFITTERKMSL